MTLKEVRDRIENLLDTNDKPKAIEMIQWLAVLYKETEKEGPGQSVADALEAENHEDRIKDLEKEMIDVKKVLTHCGFGTNWLDSTEED